MAMQMGSMRLPDTNGAVPDLLRGGIALPGRLLLEGDGLTFSEHARLAALPRRGSAAAQR